MFSWRTHICILRSQSATVEFLCQDHSYSPFYLLTLAMVMMMVMVYFVR